MTHTPFCQKPTDEHFFKVVSTMQRKIKIKLENLINHNTLTKRNKKNSSNYPSQIMKIQFLACKRFQQNFKNN